MSTRKAILVAASLPVIMLTAVNAHAQTASDATRRPFRGIFGAPESPDSPHTLTLAGSIFGAYTVNDIGGIVDDTALDPWLSRTGAYQGANLALTYSFSKLLSRITLSGRLGAGVHYYHYRSGSNLRVLPTNQADVSFNTRLTRSLTLNVRQSASYSSHYNPSLSPRLGEDVGHDIALADDETFDLFELRALRLTSSLGLTQTFGRYTSAAATYHYRSVHILEDNEADDLRFHDYGSQAASVRIQHSRPMTRHATLNLGYHLRVSDRRSDAGEPRMLHNVDAGVSYSRALSLSRRTYFSFGSGSAVAMNDRIDVPGSDPRTRVRLTGNAALTHQMGRTWTAQINYSRGFRTRDGFDGLYFTDAVNADIGGLVSRRFSLQAGAAWAGSSIDGAVSGRHRGVSAHTVARYALSSWAALYARYVYYKYRFSDGVHLDPRLPRQLDRQVVRVGVTASVPLIR
jgi:hypothetical protein